MKNIGIILAGGAGRRMNNALPKQFLLLAGKTILEHSLETFHQHPEIDEIYVVTNTAYLEKTKNIIQKRNFRKVTHILPGGQERYHSTLAALRACPSDECKLLIHDAVRPLVTASMISACITALDDTPACTIAIPATDTILISDESHSYLQSVPERKFLYNVQTPQAFLKSTLSQAYQKAVKDVSFQPTDDCSTIKKYLPSVRIKILQGHPSNLKITYPEDLMTAEKILTEIQKNQK